MCMGVFWGVEKDLPMVMQKYVTFDLWLKQTGTCFLVAERYRGSPDHLLTLDVVRAQLRCHWSR